MTMTVKELVLEILYSKPVPSRWPNTIREDRVREWTEELLSVPYDTPFPPPQCALSHTLQRSNSTVHPSVMRNNFYVKNVSLTKSFNQLFTNC